MQASHGVAFDGSVNSPLVIGNATFTGGEVLALETNSINLTHVYATSGGESYRNPVVITFAAPIGSFSLFLTNNFPDVFTVSDNLGDSETLTVAGNGSQIFTLAGIGIRWVSITEQSADWDFAIDKVAFDSMPEPGTFLMYAIGLAAVRACRRRSKFSVN